jgi:cytochrome c oxidase subunit 3
MSENAVPPTSAKIDVFDGLDPAIKVRTRKMMMWFIILAVVMLFGGITSALIVLYGKLIWLHITPPVYFWLSNGFIVASSITLILTLHTLKQGNQSRALVLHVITLVLGIAFALSQHAGWKHMSSRGLGFTITQNEQGLSAYRWNTLGKLNGDYGTDYWFEMNNERLVKEGSEFYKPSDPSRPVTNTVMTTFNAFGAMLSVVIYVHIIHLIFGLIYLLINTIRLVKGRIHRDNTLSIYISGMYWHFLGGLWLYLFYFLFFLF